MGVGMTGQDTTVELINAEIDGALTGPQRAELNRLLLADPAVRVLRDSLTRTCRTLDEMPREEIPAGLHEAIVTGLPVAAPKSHVFRRAAFTGRPLLRYAAAFGGGLLVSALAFQFGKLDSTELGAGQLAGTIAEATHAEARMIVNLDQVRGSITLTGGTAHLGGLAEERERLIGVSVVVGDPLVRVELGKKVEDEEQLGSSAIAIGLGIED